MSPNHPVARTGLSRAMRGLDQSAGRRLVRRAETAVDVLAPALIAGLSADARDLAAACRADETVVFQTSGPIGRAALDLVEKARLAGHPRLAEAAEGLWEMIDALTRRGVWHTDALRLHAESLNVLATASPADARAASIIDALRSLRVGVGASGN